MVKVNLKVTQPDDPTIHELHVYESANPTGPFVDIATVTLAAGAVLEEIDVDVTSASDWFAFQWKDAAGAWLTPLSPPVKPGQFSFVELVIDRVQQRDRMLDEDIVRQESEAAIEWFFKKNPYSVSLIDIPDGQQYRTLNGLVYLTLARGILARYVRSAMTESATLGLVSFKSAVSMSGKEIEKLIDMAHEMLGIGTATVLDMTRICKIYGGKDPRMIEQLLGIDQEFAFLPYRPMWVERP